MMNSSEPTSEATPAAEQPQSSAAPVVSSGLSERRTTNDEPRTAAERQTISVALGIVLALVVLAVFYRVVGYKLLTWDDDQHITDNIYFNPLTWSNVFHFWGYSYIFMYIPVSYNFYALEVWIAGWFPSADPADKFNPAVFHLGGLLLHLGCTIFAYRLMLRLVCNATAALCGALLFAIHPLQVESVCWVGETRGTLSTLFSFAAVWYYLNYAGVDPERGIFAAEPYEPPERRLRDAIFGLLLFGLSLLSKPSASSLPLLVVVIDFVLLRHSLWRIAWRLWPWVAAAAVIVWRTKVYQNDDTIEPLSLKPWHIRPLVAGDAYAFYLGKLLWPFDLGFDYGRTPNIASETPGFYRAWLAPLLLVVASIALPRRRIWLGCYGLFLTALLPVSGIVPFIYQNISTVADRYMYVPMFGLGLLLAAWLASRRNKIVPLAITALVLGFFSQRSIEQCATWRDDYALYLNGMRVNPSSYMSHLNLGNRYREEGHIESAMQEYRRLIEIRPQHGWAHVHLGGCLAKLGRHEEAVREFQTAINIYPKFVEAYFGMGDVAKLFEDYDGAERWYRDAVKAGPDETDPHVKLGELLIARSAHKQGEEKARYAKEGDEEFAKALKIAPDSAATYRAYGRALVEAGRLADAETQLEMAFELRPDHAQTLTDLGSCYLSLGKTALAVEMCERAVRENPNLIEARINRALALVSAGKPSDARLEYEQALTLLPPGSPRSEEIRQAMNVLR